MKRCKRCHEEMPDDWNYDFCFHCWIRGMDAGVDIQTELEPEEAEEKQ